MNPSEKYKLYRNVFIGLFLCVMLLTGANVKWSDWTSVTSMDAADLVPLVDDSAGDNRTVLYSNFFKNDSGNFSFENLSDGDNILFKADTAGGSPETLLTIDPDLPGLNFINPGTVPFIRIFDSSSNPYIDLYATNQIFIRGRTAGHSLLLQALDVGSGNRTLAIFDPDKRAVDFMAITLTPGAISADTDDFAVIGMGIIRVDTSGGNVTIGGFSTGVTNQIIYIEKTAIANDMIIEYDEGTGTQKFLTSNASDKTWSSRGGLTVVFDGTYWRENSSVGGV